MASDCNKCQTKVLVVSQEPNFLFVISYGLRELGFPVKTVLSIAEAIDVVETWEPDFVLSDISLSDSQGITLYDFLKMYSPSMIKRGCLAILSGSEYTSSNMIQDPDVTYLCTPPDFGKLVKLISQNATRPEITIPQLASVLNT